jgi:hypothetical protein
VVEGGAVQQRTGTGAAEGSVWVRCATMPIVHSTYAAWMQRKGRGRKVVQVEPESVHVCACACFCVCKLVYFPTVPAKCEHGHSL